MKNMWKNSVQGLSPSDAVTITMQHIEEIGRRAGSP